MEESFEITYNKKLKDLQKYIPFLEKMINHLKNTKEKSRQVQLNKMESLYSMITDKNKKFKLDILLKCEDVIEKLQNRMKPNLLSPKENKNPEVPTIKQEVDAEPKNTRDKESPRINNDKKVVNEKSEPVFEKKREVDVEKKHEVDVEKKREVFRDSEYDSREYRELTIAEKIYSNRNDRKYRPYSVAKASKQNVILPLLLEAMRGDPTRNYDNGIDNRNPSTYSSHEYHNYNNNSDEYYNNGNRAGGSRYDPAQLETEYRNYNSNNYYDRNYWDNDLEKFNFFDEFQERHESESVAEYYVRKTRYFENHRQDDNRRFDRSRSRSSSYRRECNFSNNEENRDVSKPFTNLSEERRFSNKVTAHTFIGNSKDSTPEPIACNSNEVKIEPKPESTSNEVKIEPKPESISNKLKIEPKPPENNSNEPKIEPKSESNSNELKIEPKLEITKAQKLDILQEVKSKKILRTHDVQSDTKGFKSEKNISHNKNEAKLNDCIKNKVQKANDLQHDQDNQSSEVVGAYSKYDKMYANLDKPGGFTSPLESLYGEDTAPKHFKIPKRQKPNLIAQKVQIQKEEFVVNKASRTYTKQTPLQKNKEENKLKTYSKENKIKDSVNSKTEKIETNSSETVAKVKSKRRIKIIDSDDEENEKLPVENMSKKAENEIKSTKKSMIRKNKQSMLQDKKSDMPKCVDDTVLKSSSDLVVEKPQIEQESPSNDNSLVIECSLPHNNKSQKEKLENVPKEQIQISNNENLTMENKVETVIKNVSTTEIVKESEQNKELIPEIKEQAKVSVIEEVQSNNSEHVLEFILKNFKKIKKIFESDSSSEDEKSSKRKKRKKKKKRRKKKYSSSSSTSASSDDEEVKRKKSNKMETEDHKESKEIKVPDKKLAEIEVKANIAKPEEKENIVKPKVKENIVESLKKSEIDSISSEKESVADASITSKDTVESKASSPKSKSSVEHQKPRKTELDILHEDIKEMWLGRDIMRVTGKRTCTFTKEENQTLTKKQCLPSHNECIAKASKLRVLLSRKDISKYLSAGTSTTATTNTIRKSLRLKPMPLSKQKEALRKKEISNKKKELHQIKKKSPQKAGSSLDNRDTSEIHLNPPKKRRRTSAKIKELSVERDSADEFLPKTDIRSGCNMLLKHAFKHDKNYFVKSDKTACLLCSFKGKQITSHYKIKHKDSEILISRIDPTIVQLLIEDSKVNGYQSLNLQNGPKEKYPYICPFCPANLTVDFTSNFYDHITSHTGEYRFQCSECDYEWHTQGGLTHHGSKHTEKKKLVPRPPPPNSNDVFGYICNECYYIQTLEENMKKHVGIYHENNAEIIKINLNLVGLKDQAEQRTEYVAPETLTSENHDSNEPFLMPDSFLPIKMEGSENTESKTVLKEVIEEEIKIEDNEIQGGTTDKKDDSKSLVEDDEKANNESLTAFICENDIEDENVEEKRMQKMNKILEKVNIQRTSIADHIQSKLKAVVTDISLSKHPSTELHSNTSNTDISLSNSIPKIILEPPQILNKTRPINVNEELFKWTPPQPKLKICTSKCKINIISQEIIAEKNSEPTENASTMQSNMDNTVVTEVVSQRKHAPISSIINRLQDKLQSHTAGNSQVTNSINSINENSLLPPLIHYKELTVHNNETDVNFKINKFSQNDYQNNITYNSSQKTISLENTQKKSDAIILNDQLKPVDNLLPTLSHYKSLPIKEKSDVILHAGMIKLLRRQNGDVFIACFFPRCIFCTDKPDVFEAHCKVTHSNVRFNIWLCSGCNGKFGLDGKISTLTDVFLHICNAHPNYFQKQDIADSEDGQNITVNENVGLFEDTTNSMFIQTNSPPDSRYKIVIKSVQSLSKKSQQSYSTTSAPEKSFLSLPESVLDTPPPLQKLDDFDINSINVEASTSSEQTASRKDFIRPVPLFKLLAAESDDDQSDKEGGTPKEKPDNTDVHAEPYRKTPYATNCLLDPAKIAHFYKCPRYDCTFSTFLRLEFIKHIDVHSEIRVYCLYCDTVMYMSCYVTHLEKFHMLCRFSCSHCFYRASNVQFVRVHIEMAHKNVNKVLIVATPEETMPKFTFRKSDEMPPIKSIIRPLVCGGTDCNMKTIFIDTFLDHYKMHVDKNEKLVCGYCTDILVKGTILPHFFSSHFIYPYHCRYCPKGGTNLNTLIQHQAIAHKTLRFNVISRKLRQRNKARLTDYHEEYRYLFIYTENHLELETVLSPQTDMTDEDFFEKEIDIRPPKIKFTSPQIELINVEESRTVLDGKDSDEMEFDPLSILDNETQVDFNCELCLQNFDTENHLNQHQCTKKKVKLKVKRAVRTSSNKNRHKLKAHTTVVERREFNYFNTIQQQIPKLIDGTLYPSCHICGLLTGLLQTCDHLANRIHAREYVSPLVAKVLINQESSGNKIDAVRNMMMTVDASIIPIHVRQNRWECGGKNCSRLWHDIEKLNHHISAVHFEESTYTCRHCNVTLDFGSLRIQKEVIMKHLQLHGPNLYGCDYCAYLDNGKHLMEFHVIKSHVGKRKVYCVYREFNQKAELGVKKKSLLKKKVIKTYTTKPNITKLLNTKMKSILKKGSTKSTAVEDSVTNDSITNDSITNDSITNDSITNDSITNDSITNDSITNDFITNDSVTNNSVANDSVSPILIDSSDDESTVEVTNSDNNDSVDNNTTENLDDDTIVIVDEDQIPTNTQKEVRNTETLQTLPGFVKPKGPHYQPTFDTFKCPFCIYNTIFVEEFVDHLCKKQDVIRAYLKTQKCQENVTDWIHSLTVYQAKILFFWRDTNTGIEKSCRFCSVVCDKKVIIDHEVQHLSRQMKPFQCTECVYSSFRKESLEIHINIAHKDSPHVFKQVKADVYPIKSVLSTSTTDTYLFKLTSLSDFEHYAINLVYTRDMKCHWYTVKNAKYVHKCDTCHEFFDTTVRFDQHNIIKHQKAAKYVLYKKAKCDMCETFVDTDQQLRHHIKTHFNLYKCKHCLFKSYNVRLMRKHCFDHHDTRSFEFLYDFVAERELEIALEKKRLYL